MDVYTNISALWSLQAVKSMLSCRWNSFSNRCSNPHLLLLDCSENNFDSGEYVFEHLFWKVSALLFVLVWYMCCLYVYRLCCCVIGLLLPLFVLSGSTWTWSVRRGIFGTSCFSTSLVAEELLMLSTIYVMVSMLFHRSHATTGSRNFGLAIFHFKMSNVVACQSALMKIIWWHWPKLVSYNRTSARWEDQRIYWNSSSRSLD